MIKRLDEITKIEMGQSPNSETYNCKKEGLPFFQGKADFGELNPVPTTWCNKPKKIAEKNDILISVRAPIGNMNIANETCCIGRGLASIREIENVTYYKYIYYLLMSRYEELNRKGTGSTFKAIGKEELSSTMCKIPNISIQKIIAQNLDTVQELININEERIKLLEELIKSQFAEMFGNPVKNEKKWDTDNIEQLVYNEKNSIKAGPFGSSLKKESYVKEGYKVYGQEQVIKQDVNFGEYFISKEKYKELSNYAIKENDVLISLVGSYGKILIIPKHFQEGIINPRLMKISFNKNKINTIFFKALFLNENFKQKIKNETHGGTMGILNVGIIKKLQIYVPPIELQNQFAEIIKQIDKQKLIYEKNLETAQELMNKLMDEYFN